MASNNKFLRGNAIDADGNIIEELGSDRYIIELKRHYKQALFLQAHDKYGNSQSHSNDSFDIQLEASSPYELKRFLGGSVSNLKIPKKGTTLLVAICAVWFERRLRAEVGGKRILCTLESTERIECKVSISCNGFELPESPFVLEVNVDGSNIKPVNPSPKRMTFDNVYKENPPRKFQSMLQKKQRHKERSTRGSIYYNTSEDDSDNMEDEDWQKDDESKAKADEPSLMEDAKEAIQTQVEERSRTDLMLNYSPIRSERPGGNEESSFHLGRHFETTVQSILP